MIVSKTPLRVSLFGGGSDLPEYYAASRGRTLSFATDLNIHVVVNKLNAKGFKLSYSKQEYVQNVNNIEHPIIRECIKYFDVLDAIEISTFSDVAGINGTGLGSSSAFTVGLLNGLSRFCGVELSRFDLAQLAYTIERNTLGNPVGKQDQYGCAIGGLNAITYTGSSTDVLPLNSNDFQKWIETECFLVRVDVNRSANEILSDQAEQTKAGHNTEILHEMVCICDEAVDKIIDKRMNEISKQLYKSWLLKRKISSKISNQTVDSLISKCMNSGAAGVKLLGAGGGGFLFCHVPVEYQKRFQDALLDNVFRRIKFSENGTRIVYDDGQRVNSKLF